MQYILILNSVELILKSSDFVLLRHFFARIRFTTAVIIVDDFAFLLIVSGIVRARLEQLSCITYLMKALLLLRITLGPLSSTICGEL